MVGEIKRKIDKLLDEVSQGNPVVKSSTRAKLILKGIRPDIYTEESEDDPQVLEKLNKVAHEFNVQV